MTWQTNSKLVSNADVAEYERLQDPASPVRLGVISNPFSRTNARTRLHDRRLPHVLQSPQDAVHTRTAAELDRALRHLLFTRKVNVLGLNGGDGTLHLGLNRLLVFVNELQRMYGRHVPLPPLLFLNGGTLNMVSRATGTKGNPAHTVRAFMKRYGGSQLNEINLKSLPVLTVSTISDDVLRSTRHGFIFGSEVVANALEMYGLFGEGYSGLMRFFTEVLMGYTLNTRLWQEHGWKLDAPMTPIKIDDGAPMTYLAAVASTIDLALAKGVLTALRTHGKGGFSARILTETDPGRVIRSIPRLLIGGGGATIRDVPLARSLQLRGGYTLDGEVFLDRTPKGLRREVEVSIAPFQLRGIVL